jgi:hypothetical protein
MKRPILQIATILGISALVAAQSGNQPPAPPPTGAMIAPQGWVPQNPPAQPNGQQAYRQAEPEKISRNSAASESGHAREDQRPEELVSRRRAF